MVIYTIIYYIIVVNLISMKFKIGKMDNTSLSLTSYTSIMMYWSAVYYRICYHRKKKY